MTILFCNIGWMEQYRGLGAGDHISGGGAYVREKGRGHEICNFAKVGRMVYGYVQPPGQLIDIDRIGAHPNDDAISGVTVVWTATRPTGGTAVVGWYKNATVFRSYQFFEDEVDPHSKNKIDGYWISAASKDATLLSVDQRTCEIPRQVKGGMGQSNIWYADKPESRRTIKTVSVLLKGKKPSLTKPGKTSKNQDQERKAKIEKSAIRVCCDYYESLGYAVTSVEKDNVGWDLTASSGKTTLRVEVKGLSGRSFAIELTPNEYKAFSSSADDYRLAVVVSALNNPVLHVCRYSSERARWLVEGQEDRVLEVLEKKSAAIRCS